MLSLLSLLIVGLKWLIFIDVILSWVMPVERFPRNVTTQITDPLYAPIRAVLSPQKMGGLDISPMVVLMMVWAMESMLRRGM